MLVGFISSGAGDGDYVVARIVLPFACLSMGEYFGAAWVVTLLAILQYPFYGALLDKSSHKAVAAGAILTMHSALSVWLFMNNWWRFR